MELQEELGMARTLGIAGIQMEVAPGADNSEAALRLLNKVASSFPWVDVVLFSELCVPGLNPDRGVHIPSELTVKFCEWSRKEKKWLIPGSFFEKEGEKVFNTAIVISPNGEIAARYRKLFPWRPLEKNDAGDSFCVFDIPGKGRLGLCICYDQWFPEVVRTLAWMGAEAILHPTATYTSDRPQELVLSQAHAIFNQVFFLSVNGVGAGGVGSSIFVDPEGRVLQVGGQREAILTEIIDLDEVQRVREFGTLGLSQLWKDLRDFGGPFPIYQEGIRNGEVFKSLGRLKLHDRIG
jgi:predicted amidohydrolase